MKKPHMVKKCARPGMDHLSRRRCPKTSETSAQTRWPGSSVCPGAGLPDVISLNNHRTRRAANAATTSVMPMPTTSLMSICVVTESLPNALLIQPALYLTAKPCSYLHLPSFRREIGCPNLGYSDASGLLH